MDRLDRDLAALAATPAPAGLARLDGAVELQLAEPALGWPQRGALAAVALALGLAMGAADQARPAADGDRLYLSANGGLLPSTLLLADGR